MATGTIKWFDSVKGIGFIRPDDGGGDVFVHVNALKDTELAPLNEGQKVHFEPQQSGSGRISAGQLKRD